MKNLDQLLHDLNEEIITSTSRLDRAKASVGKKEELEKALEDAELTLVVLDQMQSKYKKMLEDVEDYIAERNSGVIRDIQMAIYKSRSIVKECEDVIPQFDGDTFWLEDNTGRTIRKKEGEGVKSLISLFMRHMCLMNTDFISVIILDECMAELNEENSAEFSKYLDVLGRETLIILIEQKESVYANVNGLISYRVEKIQGESVVTQD